MATMQKKANLTINPGLAKDVKPAEPSPTFSVDSGIGMGSPANPDRTMVIPESPRNPTAPPSPISVIVNGYPIDAAKLSAMARELAEARANSEFPITSTPDYVAQATLDDHARLVHLRQVRGNAPREEWPRMREATVLLVSIARDIRQRDSLRGEETQTNNLHASIENMVRGCRGETNLYQIVQHAVHRAMQNHTVQNDLAAGGANMSNILGMIREVIQDQASTGRHGVTEENMETILEEVFGTIEHALVDASAPLRMNVNRMDNINDANQAQVNRMDLINDANQAHVTAIGQHVNAIGSQVNALGTNLTSLGGSVNTVSSNVQTLGSQLNLLQTILNMLPQMVTRAIQEILPQTLQEAIAPALVPIIVARLQERIGTPKGGVPTKGSASEKSADKKEKKPGFFKRFFGGSKRGGFDDDAAAGSACC